MTKDKLDVFPKFKQIEHGSVIKQNERSINKL